MSCRLLSLLVPDQSSNPQNSRTDCAVSIFSVVITAIWYECEELGIYSQILWRNKGNYEVSWITPSDFYSSSYAADTSWVHLFSPEEPGLNPHPPGFTRRLGSRPGLDRNKPQLAKEYSPKIGHINQVSLYTSACRPAGYNLWVSPWIIMAKFLPQWLYCDWTLVVSFFKMTR